MIRGDDMKLNNGGWGYREMIIYSCIIIFALVFVAISISSFYDDVVTPNESITHNNNVVEEEKEDEKPIVTDTDYYALQELKLMNATLDYVNTYSYDLTNDILKVSIDTLVSFNFMSEIYDQTGTSKCSGYSNVYITDKGSYEIRPYISCSNYVTSGY